MKTEDYSEDYIDFETAEGLNTIGFDSKYFADHEVGNYRKLYIDEHFKVWDRFNSKYDYPCQRDNYRLTPKTTILCDDEFIEGFYPKLTLYEAQKWLRVVKGVNIEINKTANIINNSWYYSIVVNNDYLHSIRQCDKNGRQYSEALLDGIKRAIDMADGKV